MLCMVAAVQQLVTVHIKVIIVVVLNSIVTVAHFLLLFGLWGKPRGRFRSVRFADSADCGVEV